MSAGEGLAFAREEFAALLEEWRGVCDALLAERKRSTVEEELRTWRACRLGLERLRAVEKAARGEVGHMRKVDGHGLVRVGPQQRDWGCQCGAPIVGINRNARKEAHRAHKADVLEHEEMARRILVEADLVRPAELPEEFWPGMVRERRIELLATEWRSQRARIARQAADIAALEGEIVALRASLTVRGGV